MYLINEWEFPGNKIKINLCLSWSEVVLVDWGGTGGLFGQDW